MRDARRAGRRRGRAARRRARGALRAARRASRDRRPPTARADGGTRRPAGRLAGARHPRRGEPAEVETEQPGACSRTARPPAVVRRGEHEPDAARCSDSVSKRRRNASAMLVEIGTGSPGGRAARCSASGDQLEQGERVAGGRAVQPLGDLRQEGSGRFASSSAAAASRAEPFDAQDRQVGAVEQRRLVLAHGEQDGDRVGDQPPDGEQQRLGARAVEPVRVVDEHEQRSWLRRGSRAGSASLRRLRSGPARAPGRRASAPASAAACGSGIRSSATSAGRSSSSSPAKGTCASDSMPRARRTRHARRRLARVVEQRRLADARLADQREHAALAGAGVGQQPVERPALDLAPQQHVHDCTRGPGSGPGGPRMRWTASAP